ncbi:MULTISPECIES: protease complex subunit PrcB family protein [unclassified Flavobacterium]|uniref:protease complex subunit PrcB family protein n=1 Tax=unclassified Flavobacterium TaxID=196869 RepID=UPI001F147D52|nr:MULTISPECIES: protease complex subunit PrcB family protein [unclassified Flavobacterium]UMY65052.1 protease complex subunit PrcB family protein [Flavobacterium sp. HJ-32-4]
MKKTLLYAFLLIATACGTSKSVVEKRPLYEVLLQNTVDGGKFEFYETITEPREFTMILTDPELKGKVKANDIQTSNFVLLNMGEKPSAGYAIGVKSVEETDRAVIITVEKKEPAPDAVVAQVITAPYALIRINSKKEIIIQ